jgi:energy-coupling factor transporter ATP-binding protein EcfA2
MIRLLEKDSNARGALFARLTQDVFHALGYHEFRLGTPKAGRELDLWANHRVEARSALAECKATKKPIGGDAVNKFMGALEMERHGHPGRGITGYVVSLGGFTAAARAQEEALPVPRVILLDSVDVERELVHARLIVAREAAVACAIAHADDAAAGAVELLAWEGGWAWCCQLERAGDALGYVLVHADGRPLGPRAADALKGKDQEVGGRLARGADLGPRAKHASPVVAAIKSAYLAYVAREFGDITVDGLPADERVGSQSISLEQLYVPLRLDSAQLMGAVADDGLPAPAEGTDAEARVPIGEVLARERSVAVLGAPGSGKSTLLKRLAVAYADPDRRLEIADGLPEESWLPLVIRCRQLPAAGGTTIRGLLAALPQQGEFEDADGRFDGIVSAALADGEALVLIDGLDEISDDSARLRFVKQLRTFIGTYPAAHVVVTSREASFRVVAGAVSDICAHYSVSALDRDDIVQLTRAWHRLVVGQSKAVEQDAERLAQQIFANARVRQLAVNPLLLTTLLLVRRWVGEIPRKRTVLYEKAIEVLLMTWNVEGHEPIDLEEAIPQLAYIAYSMTASEQQSLSSHDMHRLLREAREELPEVLGYARTGPAAFVERVEERSSLLSLSGHALIDGTLTAQYEFKHLTFQEYLTAVACVRGFHPGARQRLTPLELLEPHFKDSSWREVIPLAAVLAGRDAAPLVEELCESTEDHRPQPKSRSDDLPAPAVVLARVLADEAMVPPPLVERACCALASFHPALVFSDVLLRDLLTSRYGEQLEQTMDAIYFADRNARIDDTASMYALSLVLARLEHDGVVTEDSLEPVERELRQRTDPRALGRGALMLMELAFRSSDGFFQTSLRPSLDGVPDERFAPLAELNEAALTSDWAPTHYAAAWSYAWLGGSRTAISEQLGRRIAPRLLQLWRESDDREVQRMAAWSFSQLPFTDEDIELGLPDEELDAFLRAEHDGPRDEEDRDHNRRHRMRAALLAARIANRPWSAQELARLRRQLDGETG